MTSANLKREADEHATRISGSLRVAITASFILRLGGSCTGLLLAFYLRQVVHADANIIGALAAVFFATELLLAPVFGALSDLHGRKPFLVIGPLAGAIAVQIHPLTTIAAILALGRLMEGLSTAANTPGTLGYLADATSGSGRKAAGLRGRVMGLYEMSFVVGLVGGNLIGGPLWERLGANGFRVVSVIYLAAAALLFFMIPESLPAAVQEHHARARAAGASGAGRVRDLVVGRLSSYADLLREPALRNFVPAWLAVNAIVGLWFTHIAPTLVRPRVVSVAVADHLLRVGAWALEAANRGPTSQPFGGQLLVGHFAPNTVGVAFASLGATFMIGIFLWSLVYGRLRRTTMMLTSIGGLFLLCVAMAGINNNVLPGPWGQWPLVPLAVIGVLLESGFTPVALAYLAEISEKRVEHRGVVMGLYSVFLGIGQLIGGAGGGVFIVDMGFNGLLLASALLGLIALSAVMWLRVKYQV